MGFEIVGGVSAVVVNANNCRIASLSLANAIEAELDAIGKAKISPKRARALQCVCEGLQNVLYSAYEFADNDEFLHGIIKTHEGKIPRSDIDAFKALAWGVAHGNEGNDEDWKNNLRSAIFEIRRLMNPSQTCTDRI